MAVDFGHRDCSSAWRKMLEVNANCVLPDIKGALSSA